MARTCRRTDDQTGWQIHMHQAEVLQWSKEELARESLYMRAQAGDLTGVEPTLFAWLAASHPDEQLILEALVYGYLCSQRINEAVHWTGVWIDRHPDDWEPYLLRGQAWQMNRSQRRAIADYQHALDRKPDHAEARLRLADALMLDGNFTEALEQFQKYRDRHPDDPAGLLGVANCQYSLGKPEEARAALQALLARQPEHAAACFLEAKLEKDAGHFPEALDWLRRAEKLAPHETDISSLMASVLRELGQNDEAAQYERKLDDLRGQLKRLDDLRKQVKADPDNVGLRHQAGVLCLELGQDEEAARWFASVLRLDPNHVPTHLALADYYQKQGDVRRAEQHRRFVQGK
jgi:tetratricopeptide (TPR) repeat protein